MQRRAERVLATVLFTDIVGSSAVLAELGDRRWRALLDQHHGAVRAALRRFGGREVDTAGDGFFAVFGDQEAAIRCACEICSRVRDWGIEVRAGLTVGQVERRGRTHGGVAVHTGARIMAQAGAGEVLVSRVLRDLVAGSGIGFADRGVRRLKGISEPVHVYMVESLDGVPLDPPSPREEASARRNSIQAAPRVLRHPRRLVAALLVTLALAAAGALLLSSRGAAHAAFRPSSIAELDPANGRLLGDVLVADPTGTTPAAIPGRRLVVFSYTKQVVTILGTAHPGVKATVNVGAQGEGAALVNSAGVAYSGGHIWVATTARNVIRIDPHTYTRTGTYHLAGAPEFVLDVLGVPWAFSRGSSANRYNTTGVFRYNPTTNQFQQITSIADPTAVAFGEGAVWASTYADTVDRIDPHTGHVQVIEMPADAAGPTGITVAFNSVWTANLASNTGHETLTRIDPATGHGRTIPVGPPTSELSAGVAAADGSIWVTNPGNGTIVRVDPITMKITNRVRIRYDPRNLVAAYNRLWLVVSAY